MMKRIFSVCLALTFIICSCNIIYAQTDYENSFAKEDIENLISIGAVNNTDNIFPEREITRAEFVKVINKAFVFTEKADENFADVNEDSWYYDEFLIAKKNGYLTGDDKGNASPDKKITRSETAVILSRILNLEQISNTIVFTDAASIPDWAEKSINTLVGSEIISGYPDGSFKPNGFLTRAEGFALINRSCKIMQANDTKEETAKENDAASSDAPPVPIVNTGSSTGKGSGGGGGGGGGSSSAGKNKNVSLPVINQLSEENAQLTFTTVTNAVSYTITASYDTYSSSKEIRETSKDKQLTVDLSDIISAITDNVKLPEFPVAISIKTNAASGYISSAQHEIGTIIKKFTFLDAPAIRVEMEALPTAEHLVISWNEVENADDYDVSVTVDSADVTSSVLINKQSRVAVIKDLSLVNTASEIKFEISAISNSSDIISSVPAVHYIDYNSIGLIKGSGLEEDPYIIKNADDFELIRSNPDKHFLLAANITIEGYFEPFGNFSGSLKGYDVETNTPKKRSINININKPSGDKVGLFQELSGSAAIDNIIIEGSISGSGMVGAIAGTSSSGTISITNCVNKANITANASNAGGILGSLSVGGTAVPVIDHCSNLADITSNSSNVGGIIGYPSVNSSTIGISNCSNYGQVIGISNIGGIAGAAYAGITKSFNAGYVESLNGAAGGIVGITSRTNDPITYCYNVGTVKAYSIAGGIAYGPANASSSILVKYCYYAGEALEGNTNNFPICTTNSASSLTNNLYVLENNINELDGTISVTSDELKDADNPNTRILLTGEDDENKFVMLEGFMYPQLPDNLYGKDYLSLPLATAENADADAEKITWENSDERIVKYNVKVMDKTDYSIIANEEIDASETGYEQFSFQFESGILYEIIITGISSDGNTSDSISIFRIF